MSSPRGLAEAVVIGLAGLLWIALTSHQGVVVFLLGAMPGALMLTAGVATCFQPTEPGPRYLGALGAVLGILVWLPVAVLVGFGPALWLALAVVVAFVAEGRMAVSVVEATADVPPAPEGVRPAAEAALDDAVLALMVRSLPAPQPGDAERSVHEVEAALGLYSDRGWLTDVASFHVDPPEMGAPTSAGRASFRGMDYRHFRFESAYEPHADEPGRDRWLGYAANRTAHAWVLEHEGPPRPWLVCIHGYQMGLPWMDLSAFDAKTWHQERGLNLLFPVLPLHGPRMRGRISGEGFLGLDFLDTVHAEAQAMSDIRQLLGWVREREAPAVGVYGLSLGGYTTALLTSLEDGFDCAVAGIPVTDFARTAWHHGHARTLIEATEAGVERAAVEDVLRVISPLALPSRVRPEHRAIFGGTADQIVPPIHVRDLWQHWEQPEIAWYPGAHLTFMSHAHVGRLVARTLRDAGVAV